MSWNDFARIIKNGYAPLCNWEDARRGNPNTPQDALKTAILQTVIDPRDMAALERLCNAVIDLVQQGIELSSEVDRCQSAWNEKALLRRELMQMPADTPHLSEALRALGYDKDGLL